MTTQLCPICSTNVTRNPRYPRYVCAECAVKAASLDGRLLEFSNVDFSGGFVAHYADNGSVYPSHECYIDGIKCHADEARFGGIVIQAQAGSSGGEGSMKFQRTFTDEQIVAAFRSRGAAPEQCWVCANLPIYRSADGSGRPLFLGDSELEDACVQYLLRIGRPDVQLKGE